MPYKDKEQAREYNREYNREYMKKRRRQLSPEEIREQYVRQRTNDRLGSLVRTTRMTAKRRGIEHTITKEDLTQPEFCPLTGIKIDWSVSGRHMANPSVDRIDPNKGYIPGNIEVMSCLGNSMKNNATPEQLVHFAQEILKRYGSVSAGHRIEYVEYGGSL